MGLGDAVDYALSWGLETIEARVTALAAGLRERLEAVDGVRVHDLGEASLRHRDVHRRRCLFGRRAAASGRAPGEHQCVAGRDALLDLPERELPDLVRASVHYYNTDEELDQLVDALPPPR